MSLLIGLKNTATQTVATNNLVSLGSTYRRYSKRYCNANTFVNTSTTVTLQQSGMYHVIVTLVGSGDAAGDITVSLLEDNTTVSTSTQTVTTPTTEIRTLVLEYFTLVDNTTLLNSVAVTPKVLSLLNTGVDATFTSVIVDIVKVV